MGKTHNVPRMIFQPTEDTAEKIRTLASYYDLSISQVINIAMKQVVPCKMKIVFMDKNNEEVKDLSADDIFADKEESDIIKEKVIAYKDVGLTLEEIAVKLDISVNEVERLVG